MTATCDKCDYAYECDDENGGIAHFVDEEAAVSYLGDSGWRLQVGVLTCPQCTAERDCAIYGHNWQLWTPCLCGDCTYEFRWCPRCNALEETGTSTCSPVDPPESWHDVVTAAVLEVFPMGVAETIVRADGFGALVDRVRERSQLVDATPCDVLRAIDEGDQWSAGRVDEPAAFLAAKVRAL